MPADARIAVQAWNIMGGLEWAALPVVIEMLGVRDVEMLVTQLIEMRRYEHEKSEG